MLRLPGVTSTDAWLCCVHLNRLEAGRINYVTPTSYLELITAFTTLLASKRAEVGAG
jgi:hypothetical protein